MTGGLQDEIKQGRPFSSLRQEAFLSLSRTSALLTHAWTQRLRPYGVTLTQYNVLRILRGAGGGGLNRQQVSERLITQVPDVSRLLDRMTAAGLVTRARGQVDRRVVNSCVTEKGLAILQALDVPSYVIADEQLAHMPDSEISQLVALLEKVRSGLTQAADESNSD